MLILLLFVSGTAVVGLVHQIGWMATSSKPIFDTESAAGSDSLLFSEAMNAAKHSMSKGHLKQMVLAFHNYADSNKAASFPPGSTIDAQGLAYHGWMTYLLPYMGMGYYSEELKLDKPWTDPVNVPIFRSPIDYYWNPGVSNQYCFDEQRLALAHYAGNVHVLYPNGSLGLKDFRDGASQTILGGEVPAGFLPWGSPYNVRDPALGINRGPAGFGGASRLRGANMMFADGMVRMISEDIDPAVLRALSTPAGDDHVDGFD
jgi:hypothetical protein